MRNADGSTRREYAAAGLLFMAGLLVLLAVLSWFYRAGDADAGILRWSIPAIFLVDAAGYAGLSWGVRRQQRGFDTAAIVYLALNILLPFFDQFGFADLVYVLLTAAVLLILLRSRRPGARLSASR